MSVFRIVKDKQVLAYGESVTHAWEQAEKLTGKYDEELRYLGYKVALVAEPESRKVGWMDSCNQPSRIHLVEGQETACGYSLLYIPLWKVPSKKHGRSNYCKVCFANVKKSIEWDVRCLS